MPRASGTARLAAHASLHDRVEAVSHDLIDLGRTGSVEMEPEAADTGSIVGEVLFEQRALLEERNVEVQVLGALPRLWCNRRRLKQIVTNLVRNALRHGLDGNRPRLTIDSPDLGERNRTTAALRIGDNGRGIPPAWRTRYSSPAAGCQDPCGGFRHGVGDREKIVGHYGAMSVPSLHPTEGRCLSSNCLHRVCPNPCGRPPDRTGRKWLQARSPSGPRHTPHSDPNFIPTRDSFGKLSRPPRS